MYTHNTHTPISMVEKVSTMANNKIVKDEGRPFMPSIAGRSRNT